MAERASLVRLEKEFDIEVDWRGFELHPETPKGGRELPPRPSDGQPEKPGYMQLFAARFGINDMRRTQHIPNTRRALAMAEFARDQGKLNEFRTNTMNAHWRDGRDIEDTAVLTDMAKASGLDPENALLAADDLTYIRRVDNLRLEYKQVGVGGIPTFVIGDEKVEGCQPYEILAAAAIKAGAKRRIA